jgi:hypothetical protein
MSHLRLIDDENVEIGPTPILRGDGFVDKIARDREVARR